ncbi:MAG: efflux RND transporter permease subunit [Spirochaetes bacterium]|nr:efflux RND transporter permease subunit [Spirochaetota bacterium]
MIFKENYLKRPVSVIMAFLFMMILGIVSFFKLPVSLMPEQKTPWISIIVEYPGISPQKIENLITGPIEEKISTISGIVKVLSVSEEGKSRINIQFDIERDIDLLILEIREKVDIVKSTFPRDVQEPMIIKYDPSETPVFILTLSSKRYDIKEIRNLAEHKFKKRFQRIDGVSEIFVSGGLQREIHVDVDYYKLLAKNMDLSDVFREIQFGNIHLSSGLLYRKGLQVPLLTPWKYTTLNQIEETGLFTTEDGKIIKVKDVGQVKDTFKEKDSISRVDLHQRVSIYIQKSGIANTVAVIERIKDEITLLQERFRDIEFEIIYDQAHFIKSALSRVKQSVIIGSVIAALVLFLFLRSFQSTLIISVSIPISVIVTFTFFYFKKISLNVFSLSGLALAVGMLVDNSIIVLENIFARKEITPAVKSIEKAVIASTLTTIAVFLPIVFTNKEVQIMYGDITLAVIFSILFSLFTALVLLPVLTGLSRKNSKLTDCLDKQAALLFFLFKSHMEKYRGKLFFLNKINKESYTNFVKRALFHYKKILVLAMVFIIVAFFLSGFIGQEYIDPLDTGSIRVFVELPSGTNLDETDKKVKQTESLLKGGLGKYIKRISSRIEKAHATLVIELNKKRRLPTKIFIKKAREITRFIREADVIFSEPSSSEGMTQNEVSLNLTGKDPDTLKSLARELAGELNTIKQVTDIIFHFKPSQEQISVLIDREKAMLNSLNSHRIANFLREAVYGPVTTKYFDKDHEIDVRVKLDKKHLTDLEDLESFYIKNAEGYMIPLVSIARIEKSKAPSKIYRLNKHRTVSMALKYEDIDLGGIIKKIENKLKNFAFPGDYHFEFGENYKKMVQNKKEMIFAIVIAFILIYLILASILQDLVDPLIIIFAIPVAVSSVLLVLLISGNSLNIAVYIGLIMLGGIVVNNSIILVDTINQLKKNLSLEKAIIQASYSRLRPIFMTTLTTVLGLLPVLLNTGEGSNIWHPLALTIISGLLFSTILTLVIVPALYLFFHTFEVRLTGSESGQIPRRAGI